VSIRDGSSTAPLKTLLLAVGLLAAWALRDVLLLVFASVLLAVVLRGTADRLAEPSRLPPTLALFVVCAGALALLAGAFWWQGPRVAEEAGILRQELPDAVATLRARVEEIGGVRRLSENLPSAQELIGDGEALVQGAARAASSTLGMLAVAGLWLFVGFLFALSPRLYRDGFVRLLPHGNRERACVVLSRLQDTLWWWSLGRMVSMTFVGVATGAGLWLLDVPLAFLLGLIAALLSFIPNLGPILAAVPAVLLALAQSPQVALWVVALYVGIQAVESLLLDPVIDRRTVYLPPALTVVAQLVLGTLVGLLGVALAAPLTAATMTVVSVLWMQGALGDPAKSADG
jgi:predicted PurR-regulated permease PerM